MIDDWDDDDALRAEREAKSLAQADPGASAFLLAQVQAYRLQQAERRAKREETQAVKRTGENFDLIKLHTLVSPHLPWLSFDTMMKMHYPTFFKYVREVEEKLQRENNEQPGTPQAVPSGQMLGNMVKRPVMWGGDVVRVNQRNGTSTI